MNSLDTLRAFTTNRFYSMNYQDPWKPSTYSTECFKATTIKMKDKYVGLALALWVTTRFNANNIGDYWSLGLEYLFTEEATSFIRNIESKYGEQVRQADPRTWDYWHILLVLNLLQTGDRLTISGRTFLVETNGEVYDILFYNMPTSPIWDKMPECNRRRKLLIDQARFESQSCIF